MKYIKGSIFLTIVSALTVWVGVGSASATTLDCNGAACALNTVIHAANEVRIVLHTPPADIECEESTVEGKLTNLGSSTTTASGSITTLTFKKCNATVTVLKPGTFEIHTRTTSSDNNGTLTFSGTEITTEIRGFHCIYTTSSTDIGTITGSATTGGNATVDVEATLPRTGGRQGAFCGATGLWTGAYKIEKPSALNVT